MLADGLVIAGAIARPDDRLNPRRPLRAQFFCGGLQDATGLEREARSGPGGRVVGDKVLSDGLAAPEIQCL